MQNVMTLSLVVLGPLLALATFVALGPFGQGANSTALRLILLADFVYFLLLATLNEQYLVGALSADRLFDESISLDEDVRAFCGELGGD